QIKSLAEMLLCLMLMGIIASCNGKKNDKAETPEEAKEIFATTLTAADTTEVVGLANQCMDLLKENKTEEALKMIFVMNEEGEPVPVSGEQKQKLNGKFKLFPVLEYELVNFSFASEENNDMRYKIIFDKSGDVPASIGFMFNPVRIDGNWYLMLKESDQEINR
ncbi:hypothetical protein, partial [Bacteroides heparinolyticus]